MIQFQLQMRFHQLNPLSSDKKDLFNFDISTLNEFKWLLFEFTWNVYWLLIGFSQYFAQQLCIFHKDFEHLSQFFNFEKMWRGLSLTFPFFSIHIENSRAKKFFHPTVEICSFFIIFKICLFFKFIWKRGRF